MPEECFHVGHAGEAKGFDGAVGGSGEERVGAWAEGEGCYGRAVVGEGVEGFEVGGGPDFYGVVCAACGDELACGGGGDGEDGGGVGVCFWGVGAGGVEFGGAAAEGFGVGGGVGGYCVHCPFCAEFLLSLEFFLFLFADGYGWGERIW